LESAWQQADCAAGAVLALRLQLDELKVPDHDM